VSKLVAERGGYDLMPEMDYQPTNKYLPPRPRKAGGQATQAPALADADAPIGGLLGWLDKLLSR
jgi:hypothetical protein